MDSFPIADLHCDLLFYLVRNAGFTPYDEAARCSIPQLKSGGVFFQTLAIFNYTARDSSIGGRNQGGKFKELPYKYPQDILRYTPNMNFEELRRNGKICIIAAIENASGFCDEYQSFAQGLDNLSWLEENCGPLLYISLTWKYENRFGGGDQSKVGLKDDGRRLLDHLNGKKIAIDFAHTSDWLAADIFEHIDKHKLDLPVLASHANVRAVHDNLRNLPLHLFKEICKRSGIVGLNIIKKFVGDAPEKFSEHMRYALEKLDAEGNLALGADFFYDAEYKNEKEYPFFFDEFGTAEMYPRLLSMVSQRLGVSRQQLERLTSRNVEGFLTKLLS